MIHTRWKIWTFSILGMLVFEIRHEWGASSTEKLIICIIIQHNNSSVRWAGDYVPYSWEQPARVPVWSAAHYCMFSPFSVCPCFPVLYSPCLSNKAERGQNNYLNLKFKFKNELNIWLSMSDWAHKLIRVGEAQGHFPVVCFRNLSLFPTTGIAPWWQLERIQPKPSMG